MTRRGWHSRGYLPHFDGEETTQFVTFRLADALPRERLEAWRSELRLLPEAAAKAQLHDRIERYLDTGVGSAVLCEARFAAIVEDRLRCREGEHYDLDAWVIMPNHVHVLFTSREGFGLSEIIQAWKSVSARQINRALGREGRLWQQDYFDRYIRDARHFERALAYIEWNPVGAGLCEEPAQWPFGSARFGARTPSSAVGARTPSSAGVEGAANDVDDVATAADVGVRAPNDEGHGAHREDD